MLTDLSPVDICNLALSHVGVALEIQALNDNTKEARACNRFFNVLRQNLLRKFPWPFATSTASLILLSDPNLIIPATIEWQFSYRLPSDVLRARRILNDRRPTWQTVVPYRIEKDSGGGILLTDYAPIAANSVIPAQPQLEYTVDVTDTTQFPADLAMAFSYALGKLVAPRVTTGDPYKLGDKCAAEFKSAWEAATGMAMDEEQPDKPAESEFVRAREGYPGFGVGGEFQG